MKRKSFFVILILFCALWSCETEPFAEGITGCTDIHSLNYNPDATIDDNSCEYDDVKFIGSYRIITNCYVAGQSTSTNYDVFVEQTDNAAYNLRIRNLFDRGKTAYGNIAGDYLIEILEQDVEGSTYRGNLVIQGADFSGVAFRSPDTDCNFSGKKL